MAIKAVGAGVILPGVIGLGQRTVKSLIKDLFNTIDKTIEDTINEGNNALMARISQVGDELKRVIDHFAETYKGQLDYTFDRLNDTAQAGYNQLASMVDHFATKLENELQIAFIQAQQFANTLPYSDQKSQLSFVRPRCFVLTSIFQSSIVNFHGNFPYAASPGYEPSLVLGKTTCVCINSTTQQLQFQFPNTLFGDFSSQGTKYSLLTGKLTAPWVDKGYIYNSTVYAIYHVTLLALPPIAGTVQATFRYSQNVQSIVREKRTIGPVTVSGKKYEAKWLVFKPDPNCTFDPATVQVNIGGNYHYTKQEFVPAHIGYTVHFNAHGSATYTITVDQLRTVNSVEQRERTDPPFELKWGEGKSVTPANGETLIRFIFKDCRDQEQTFISPFLGKGILSIQQGAIGQTLIQAQPPADIDQFMNSVL